MIDATGDCLVERRKRLRRQRRVFGLDFVDVGSAADSTGVPRTIRLYFLGQTPSWLTSESILLRREGSQRRLQVELLPPDDAHLHAPSASIQLIDPVCDGVNYTLTVNVPHGAQPVLDPFFASLTFRFDPHSPAQADCLTEREQVAGVMKAPAINYLAKDYATFRQLLLDRLSVTIPNWRDRSPADMGVMLVEIMAYVADHLSYYQDAVVTEAYLGTARLRQSLRRHARLVDYHIHEGCNARAWVQLQVNNNVEVDAKDLFFVAHPISGMWQSHQLHQLVAAPKNPCQVFEPVVSKQFNLWRNHNVCRIHDWGGAQACLPPGTTSAFLVNQRCESPDAVADDRQVKTEKQQAADDTQLHFQVGDVVVLEEILSPWTGSPHDADQTHRHVVRLSRVEYEYEVQHEDGSTSNVPHHDHLLDIPLVKISWEPADAVPFTLWLTKPPQTDWLQAGEQPPITVARGNMLLVDHGLSVHDDPIDLKLSHDAPASPMRQNYPAPRVIAALPRRNLTFSDRLPESGAPAAFQTRQDSRRAVPQLVLRARSNERNLATHFSLLELRDTRRIARRLLDRLASGEENRVPPLPQAIHCAKQTQAKLSGTSADDEHGLLANLQLLRETLSDDLHDVWLARYDLLDSGPNDPHFVVEMSDDRVAQLRFGQHGFGKKPPLADDPTKKEMLADYRIGSGTAGNVPAESIRGFGSYGPTYEQIVSVRNPLAASGGQEPESPQQIRLFAPHAIRNQLHRAITADDYRHLVMQHFGHALQQVKVTPRWTGHEFEVLIAVDALGREAPDPALLRTMRRALQRYRRIGHSLRVRAAKRVVPTLRLVVCLGKHVIREQVREQLNRLFSNRVLPDGRLAFFHPDQRTFQEGVFVSHIVAEAARIAGVVHVTVSQLHRSDEGPAEELEKGILPLRAHEIVRFDNDPRQLQFGLLGLELKGGR